MRVIEDIMMRLMRIAESDNLMLRFPRVMYRVTLMRVSLDSLIGALLNTLGRVMMDRKLIMSLVYGIWRVTRVMNNMVKILLNRIGSLSL